MVTIAGMKLRSFIALVVGCCLFVAEGINYSQLAPFFPTEAETKKGLDEFHVGIVNSSFDIATIFFTAVLAVVATPELNKFFFLWGALIGAVALICFGVLALGPGKWWYLSMCLFCRILMGIGANMLWSTGIPLLTSLAPQHSGKITSLTESGVGLGFAIGPPIGSLIYSIGGYMYPFLCCGLIEIALLSVAVLTIPSFDVDETKTSQSFSKLGTRYKNQYDDDCLLESEPSIAEVNVHNDDVSVLPGIRTSSSFRSEDESKYSGTFKTLLSYPGIWCVSSFVLSGAIPFGLFNVTMGPYLLDSYGIQGDSSGFYFLIMGAFYAFVAQLIGYFVDKGYASYIFFWNNLASVAVLFTFSLPLFVPKLETKVFLVLMLALNGLIESATFVPLYVIMEQIAVKSGYSFGIDDLRLKIAIWINFIMSVGKIIGSVVLGGILYKHFGFYWVLLISSAFFVIGAILSNTYILLSKNYRKIFYHV